MTGILQKALYGFVLASLAACGLTISDAERIDSAKLSMQDGDYRAAEVQLKSVLKNDPDNVEVRLRLARVHLGLNDLAAAEKEARRAAELAAPIEAVRPLQLDILTREGRYAEVLASLDTDLSGLSATEVLKFRGEALLGINDGSAAETMYRDWLAVAPDSADAAVGFAKARALQGDLGPASESLEQVLAVDPQHTNALLALAILRYGQGDFASALEAYQRALSSSQPQANFQRHLYALVGLSDTQLMMRDIEGARKTIEQLAGYTPSAPYTLLQQARLAQLDKDDLAAARALQELISLSPDNVHALMLLGSVQWRLGYFQQAEVQLSRAVAVAPENLQARKMWALIQLRRSNTSEALDILEPLLDQQSQDAELFGLLAIADLQRGQSDSALDKLLLTAQRYPDSTDVKLQLAEGYRYTGDPQNAIDLLRELDTEADPEFRRERILISAYADLGQFAEAFEVANAIVASGTDSTEVLNFVGQMFITSGQIDRGREILQQARSLAPKDTATLLALAALEERINNPDEAQAFYESVLAIDTENLQATLGLSQLASTRGDSALAEEYLERAREQHPDEVRLRLTLAIGHLNDGRNREARTLARELARIGSDNAFISQTIGKILLQTGALEDAQAQYELANRLAPESAEILIGLSESLMAQGDAERAYESLQRALAIDPQSAVANSIMVLAELRLGHVDAATARMRQLREQAPRNASAMVVEGELHYELGDYEQAISAFQSAAEMGAGEHAAIREFEARVKWDSGGNPAKPLLDWIDAHPQDVKAKTMLAQYYGTTGMSTKAVALYEGLMKSQANNPVVLNNLAWEYQKKGDLDTALALALRAHDLQPKSGLIADTVGWIYLSLRNYEDSVNYLREATRLTPQNPEIQYHLAVALAEAGRGQEASAILFELINSGQQFASRAAAMELQAAL